MSRTHRGRDACGRRLRLALSTGLALGCLALAVVVVARPHTPPGVAAPVADRGRPPDLSHSSAGPPARAVRGQVAAPPAGTQVHIARLGVLAPVVHVSAPGGVMQIPLNPATLGWWSGGARPGSAHGRVVIVGHVNYAGRAGALSVLPLVLVGDVVIVSEPRRGSALTFRYSVDAVRTYSKSGGLPRDLFGTDGVPELVLITCGGTFDSRTGNYRDNVVVFAHPFDAARPTR